MLGTSRLKHPSHSTVVSWEHLYELNTAGLE
jgi:hypothetical protein